MKRLWVIGCVALVVTGCGGNQPRTESVTHVCAPTFELPATTTIPSEILTVPSPASGDIEIANVGESVVNRGAYSRVKTARALAEEPLTFLFPRQLGTLSSRGDSTVPKWVSDALSRKQQTLLEGQDGCRTFTLGAQADSQAALKVQSRLVAAVKRQSVGRPELLTVKTASSTRGSLIDTPEGVYVFGLVPSLAPMTDPTLGQLSAQFRQSGVEASGFFLPNTPSQPLMIAINDAGATALYPASGSVELKDTVTRLVRRPPVGSVVERTLIYQGRKGSRLDFIYRETDGTTGQATTQTLSHDLIDGPTVVFGAVRIAVVEATDRQLRYHLLSGF